MGTAIALFQSPGVELLFIVISSSLARYGIKASTTNYKISSGIPSGPTDFFLPIADNLFLIVLLVTVKGLSDYVN